MSGLRRMWKLRLRSRASQAVTLLAYAGMMWGHSAWAQAAPEEEPFGEVLSETRLEELLDSSPVQPSGGSLSDATFEPERLAPYFAEGSLARARAEFERGRYSRARVLLEAEAPTYPVRFLKALSAFHARDHAAAAGEFAVLADEYLDLRDQCLLRAAQANEKLRQHELAAMRYRAVDPSDARAAARPQQPAHEPRHRHSAARSCGAATVRLSGGRLRLLGPRLLRLLEAEQGLDEVGVPLDEALVDWACPDYVGQAHVAGQPLHHRYTPRVAGTPPLLDEILTRCPHDTRVRWAYQRISFRRMGTGSGATPQRASARPRV